MIDSIYNLFESGERSRQAFEYQKAKDFYLKAKERLQTSEGDETKTLLNLEGEVLNALGLVCGQLGDYVEAIRYLEHALELRQTSGGSQLEQAITLNNLGLVKEYQKELEKALKYYQQALNLVRKLDESPEICRIKAIILNNLGMAKTAIGNYDEVPALLNEALTYFQVLANNQELDQTLRDKGYQGVGQTLHNMGYTEYVSLGIDYESIDTNPSLTPKTFESIKKFYNQALEVRRKIQDKLGEARTLNNLGCLYGEYIIAVKQDEDDLLRQATAYLKEAQRLFKDMEDPIGQKLVSDSFKTVDRAKRQLLLQTAEGFVKTSVHKAQEVGQILDELF